MRKVIFLSILFLLLFGAGYIYWFYYNSFSDGTRDGVLYKFSRKGNIFKTYEGEMVQPGLRSVQGGAINTNNFFFSVSDVKLADTLDKCIGKSVKVHYIQYRKSLPWRGENYNGKNQENGQYIIDRIENVSEAHLNSGF
ncbi:MAG: hypothetical protein IPN26_18355 [Bacteroidetes bacterium]|jgi:hypothetical protein|nr:hypothetical protein [Bacteroidota bacterium]